MLTGSLSRGRDYQGLPGGRRIRKKTMNLVSIYTREQAIEDGVLMMLDVFFRDQQKAMTLNERIRFCQAIGNLQKRRNAKFPLGDLVVTTNAAAKLNAIDAFELLVRHESGDWGEVCEEDRETNERALKDGSRLFSVYEEEGENGASMRVYVITEWNREATTILLPEDY